MYALCGMQYDGEEEESQKDVNSDHDDMSAAIYIILITE